jgi:NADH:ubiquinone oxidoreductase subunit E
MERLNTIGELEALRNRLFASQDPNQAIVRICCGLGCLAEGADRVSRAFKEVIKAKGLRAEVKP